MRVLPWTQLPTAEPGSQCDRNGGWGCGGFGIALPKENKKIITATIFLARDYACYMLNVPLPQVLALLTSPVKSFRIVCEQKKEIYSISSFNFSFFTHILNISFLFLSIFFQLFGLTQIKIALICTSR